MTTKYSKLTVEKYEDNFYEILYKFGSKKITGDISSKDPSKKSNLILETLEDWKMKNDQAIYYGDTLNDAIACHDAKVKFCLVGNPKQKHLVEIQKISKFQLNNFVKAYDTIKS